MGFIQYLRDTRGELRHVAWPTSTQTTVYTILVIALSILIALYLGLFDFLFTRGLGTILEGVSSPSIVPSESIIAPSASTSLIDIQTSTDTASRAQE